jgi:hypothetical protein
MRVDTSTDRVCGVLEVPKVQGDEHNATLRAIDRRKAGGVRLAHRGRRTDTRGEDDPEQAHVVADDEEHVAERKRFGVPSGAAEIGHCVRLGGGGKLARRYV